MSIDNRTSNSGVVDRSGLTSIYADVFEVQSAAGEITLAFGGVQGVDVAGQTLSAILDRRILLSPVLAKRLAMTLSRNVNEYESLFGVLTREVTPLPAATAVHLPDGTGYRTRANAEKAATLFHLVDDLGIAYGIERSFKMAHQSLLANRFLMGFKKNAAPGMPDETIQLLFRRIGMPADFLSRAIPLLAQAEFVHFGFEEQPSGCIYKAYLEFPVQVKCTADGSRVHQESCPVFLGFKWNPMTPEQKALSHYTCFPLLSLDEIQVKIARLAEGHQEQTSFDFARQLLSQAVRVLSNDKIMYEEVSEEGNPRTSFDVNLYGADLTMRDLHPYLVDVGRRYDVPEQDLARLCADNADKKFGHLSGGIGRDGRDFLTVYYGATEGHSVRRQIVKGHDSGAGALP